jgi:LmbE family N-acetylglucosaminyl deacetylase
MPEQIPEIARVMVIMAHPDDMEFGCGGSIAKMTAQGIEATLVVCTTGNRGGEGDRTEEELSAVRRAEQEAACKVLGIKNLAILDYDDGWLTPSLELRKDLVRQIRKYRPNLVISPNPVRNFDAIGSNHPDHLAVGEASLAAIYPTARNPMALPELLDEGLDKWVVDWVWIPGSGAIDPDHFVDITDVIDSKLDALMCHASQLDPEVKDWVKGRAEQLVATAREKGWFEGDDNVRSVEAFRAMWTGELRRPAAFVSPDEQLSLVGAEDAAPDGLE